MPGPSYVTPSTSAWALITAGVALGALSANPALTVASVVSVPLFVALLWRRGEPPVLLFAVMFQWLQVTARVFHADLRGIPVGQMESVSSEHIGSAIWIGLLSVFVLAVGMRLALGWPRSARSCNGTDGSEEALSLGRVFAVYVTLLVVSAAAGTLKNAAPSIAQLALSIVSLKWVFFFVLGYLVLKRRAGWGYIAIGLLSEVVLGLGTYFSGFKTVFYVTVIAVLASEGRLSRRTAAWTAFCVTALLGLTLVWMGIRSEYRAFLSQDTRAQVVLVSWPERYEALGNLVSELSSDDYLAALDRGARRVAYVDFLAAALNYVPQHHPHEEGRLLWASVSHVLTPRAFFPNKPDLPSDSELTMKYTGLHMAGGAEGTSISLGYVGESYVDFGFRGMFFPVLVFGILWGWMYVYFVSRSPSRLFGYGFAVAVLIHAAQFETAGIKLLGGVLVEFIVLAAVMHLFLPTLFRWMVKRGDDHGVSGFVHTNGRTTGTAR